MLMECEERIDPSFWNHDTHPTSRLCSKLTIPFSLILSKVRVAVTSQVEQECYPATEQQAACGSLLWKGSGSSGASVLRYRIFVKHNAPSVEELPVAYTLNTGDGVVWRRAPFHRKGIQPSSAPIIRCSRSISLR